MPLIVRANIVKTLNVARVKTTEARISKLRAFVGHLDASDLEWLAKNSDSAFVEDLHRLRNGIDMIILATGAQA